MLEIGPNLQELLLGISAGIGVLIYFWILIQYIKHSE